MAQHTFFGMPIILVLYQYFKLLVIFSSFLNLAEGEGESEKWLVGLQQAAPQAKKEFVGLRHAAPQAKNDFDGRPLSSTISHNPAPKGPGTRSSFYKEQAIRDNKLRL